MARLPAGLRTKQSREGLSELLAVLPPVAYAAAYGSAVMQQAGYAGSGMVDYIVAVDDAAGWHRQNLERNGASHYSFLRAGGARILSSIQAVGAGVYFNVPNLGGQCAHVAKAKYAVVERRVLCRELQDWRDLYLSGRLQKPVVTLQDCPDVAAAQQHNLDMACATALLLLPETFSEPELYATISAISYTGDPRMRLGEHPDKALQIAASQTDNFRALYAPSLRVLDKLVAGPNLSRDPAAAARSRPSTWSQDMSAGSRARLLLSLPMAVVNAATREANDGLWTAQRGGPVEASRSTHALGAVHDDGKAFGRCRGACSEGVWETEEEREREALLTETIRQRPSFLQETLPSCLAGLVGPAARIQMVKGYRSLSLPLSSRVRPLSFFLLFCSDFQMVKDIGRSLSPSPSFTLHVCTQESATETWMLAADFLARARMGTRWTRFFTFGVGTSMEYIKHKTRRAFSPRYQAPVADK